MFGYRDGAIIRFDHDETSCIEPEFAQGCGLFETARVYNGTIFALDRHLRRLQNSLRELGLLREGNSMQGRLAKGPAGASLAALSFDAGRLEEGCRRVLEANRLTDARLRIQILFNGTLTESTTSITATEFTGYKPGIYQSGASVTIQHGLRSSGNILHQHKTTSYFSSALARAEARKAGYDEALLTNEAGNLCEGTYTNLFAIKDGVITTPPVSDGLLPGITREIVLDMLSQLGYQARIESISATGILDIDELFLTGSLLEIAPITAIDGKPIGIGEPGPIGCELHKQYRELVSE